MTTASWFRWDGAVLELRVLVQPKARCSRIVGVHGPFLRVRVTAPATEGKANEALRTLLAADFAVPKRRVSIHRGYAARVKTIRVDDPQALPQTLDHLLRRGSRL